jgi:hypothetical protein
VTEFRDDGRVNGADCPAGINELDGPSHLAETGEPRLEPILVFPPAGFQHSLVLGYRHRGGQAVQADLGVVGSGMTGLEQEWRQEVSIDWGPVDEPRIFGHIELAVYDVPPVAGERRAGVGMDLDLNRRCNRHGPTICPHRCQQPFGVTYGRRDEGCDDDGCDDESSVHSGHDDDDDSTPGGWDVSRPAMNLV